MYNKFMKKFQKAIIIVIVSLFSSICAASQSEDLKKLKDLYEKNLLTKDQYNEAIQKVISNSEEIIKLKAGTNLIAQTASREIIGKICSFERFIKTNIIDIIETANTAITSKKSLGV